MNPRRFWVRGVLFGGEVGWWSFGVRWWGLRRRASGGGGNEQGGGGATEKAPHKSTKKQRKKDAQQEQVVNQPKCGPLIDGEMLLFAFRSLLPHAQNKAKRTIVRTTATEQQ